VDNQTKTAESPGGLGMFYPPVDANREKYFVNFEHRAVLEIFIDFWPNNPHIWFSCSSYMIEKEYA
jgi:hypothetical protein